MLENLSPKIWVSNNFSDCFHLYKKKLEKENGFHRIENACPPFRLEDSFKNAFTLDQKQPSLERVSEKWEKISPTSQKINFYMQEFPSPNFKSFKKALNKKILFPLDKKSVSTSRNEEKTVQKFLLTLFRLTETDFRALYLLVETIVEIRQNSVFKIFLLG